MYTLYTVCELSFIKLFYFSIFLYFTSAKFGINSNMDNDNNSINSNWNVGTSANGVHENVLEEQSEQQPPANKSRMDDSFSKEESAEIFTQNDGATNDKQIRELEISTMKGELNELKMEMIALKDKFAEKLASLEEKHLNEIAEWKKLTAGFEEKIKKLEERIQMYKEKIDEAETDIMMPIREMKVQLPQENWHDLLAFVPRNQLGNVISHIGDYHFACIIQSFLHDEVKDITIGEMRIIAPRPDVSSDQPMVKVERTAATNMPDWPMPGNIRNFKQIDLNYVDTSVLHFLGKFQENSLLTDVNIDIDYNSERFDEDEDEVEESRLGEDIPWLLAKIVPFITSIDSIASPEIDLFKMVYYNDDETNKSLLLLKEMMEKTRILVTNCSIYDSDDDDFESWENKSAWYNNWLCTPRNDGKPRMLKSNKSIYVTECDSFIESITEHFEMANDPVSFFIYTRIYVYSDVESISLENAKTNEKLVIKKMEGYYDVDFNVLISRYSLDADKSWIEANEKEIIEWNDRELDRKIYMDGELIIAK